MVSLGRETERERERENFFHMSIVVFLSECRMDFIGRRYFKINKFLLCSLGLWPHTKCIQIRSIFIYSLFYSFLFVQVPQFLFKHVLCKIKFTYLNLINLELLLFAVMYIHYFKV